MYSYVFIEWNVIDTSVTFCLLCLKFYYNNQSLLNFTLTLSNLATHQKLKKFIKMYTFSGALVLALVVLYYLR